MGNSQQTYLKAFVAEMMRAQAAFTEAKTLGCTKPVLDILSANMDAKLAALNEALGKLP